ncbi:MFS transporter [Agromyces rhizosphaerae]|uniref:MFS transporter n=1 Tax=Agromyces rhizosphaerae TaxID=88374 RepID=UPI002493951F|nr:MFS transporter [Agromyces rhizosphaerae]
MAPAAHPYAPTVLAFAAAGLVAFAELYGVQALLPAISAEFALTPSTSALVLSAGALGLAVAVVPWSIAARHVRRGLLLRIAVIATIALGPFVAVTDGFASLLAVRLAQGAVLAGIPALALTHLGDVVDRRRTAAAAGWYIAGTALGGLSGRFVAGFAATAADWRLALVAVSLLSAGAALVFLLLAPRAAEHPAAPGSTRRALANPLVWAICLLAFTQMGVFVAAYNYTGFRLLGPGLGLPEAVVTAIFGIYLVGSATAARAGALVARLGRPTTLTAAVLTQLAGLALTIPDWLPSIIAGLVVLTAGFFALHAVAAGWAASLGRGSALPSALYTIGYYAGAALIGWLLGLAFDQHGWSAVVAWAAVISIAGLAGLIATLRSSVPATGVPEERPA